MNSEARLAMLKLLAYCREQDWDGYDPYDALNSRIFRALPFLDIKPVRLAFTQAMKRCPVNLRPLLLVPKTRNPKGLALFLSSLIKLSRAGLLHDSASIGQVAQEICRLRSAGRAKWCWGYSFPWQTRKMLVPRGAPNLVCTVFVANALLDLFEEQGNRKYLQVAANSAEYILEDLYWREGDTVGFRYPTPDARTLVHNANFLAAALLTRVGRLTQDDRFLAPALAAARYSARRQRTDGSWDYGDGSTQRWIDNFHTGFNLCALRQVSLQAGTDEFDGVLTRGFNFYRNNFFREDGAPKYFHDRACPLDIHSAAQSVITLYEFRDLARTNTTGPDTVLRWTLTNLRDPSGYFYYQRRAWGAIKIPYMRWGQAWMLLALATVLQEPTASVCDKRTAALTSAGRSR